jgi:hypothetical protein
MVADTSSEALAIMDITDPTTFTGTDSAVTSTGAAVDSMGEGEVSTAVAAMAEEDTVSLPIAGSYVATILSCIEIRS